MFSFLWNTLLFYLIFFYIFLFINILYYIFMFNINYHFKLINRFVFFRLIRIIVLSKSFQFSTLRDRIYFLITEIYFSFRLLTAYSVFSLHSSVSSILFSFHSKTLALLLIILFLFLFLSFIFYKNDYVHDVYCYGSTTLKKTGLKSLAVLMIFCLFFE